jgi:hypothetical protein
LFAVAEAMPMAAFATVAVAQPRNSFLNWTIVAAGKLFTIVWFYINWVQINKTIRPIKSLIRPHIPEWKMIDEPRKRYTSPNTVMGKVFPVLVIAVWLLLGIGSSYFAQPTNQPTATETSTTKNIKSMR